jgi:hypothetical protein
MFWGALIMPKAGLLPVGTLDLGLELLPGSPIRPPREALSPVFGDLFAAEFFSLSQGEIHVLGGDA